MERDCITAWRARLDESSRIFSALYHEDAGISLPYGVVAGTLLWPIRDDHDRSRTHASLTAIAGADEAARLHGAIAQMRAAGPLAGARYLTRSALDDPQLRAALDRVLEFFRDDWLRLGLLKPASITTIAGSVEGANVVINGTQYVGGDLIVTVVRPRTRTCPTAPNPPGHFAGRRRELEQLKTMLEQGRNAAITGIHGMGGIGKTALAQQLATELDGFGAMLWASLGTEPAVVNQLVSWARHDDPEFEAGDSAVDVLAARVNASLTALVREQCAGRVLVILDDVWEGASVEAARILQRAAPRGAVCLITTRSQLVVAQLRSTRLELHPLAPSDALEMLRRLLPDLPEIRDEHLLALAEVLGNHPLALELAAGQARLLERPGDEIAGLIEQYRGGISAASPFRDIRLELGEAREDNLELVLSFSYASLPEAGRVRFRALGAMAYGVPFDQSLCRAVWQAEPRPSLDALRHRALLTLAPEPGWYQQHPLLRAYARALLARDPDELAAVTERYAEQVVGISERFGVTPLEAWGTLELYVPHVEEAGEHVVADVRTQLERPQPDERALGRGLAFALGTRRLLVHRRELRHPEWLDVGLAVSRRRMDNGHVIAFLAELGHDSIVHGDKLGGLRRFDEALEIARRHGDRAGLARTRALIGDVLMLSDADVAGPYLREAAEEFAELGDTAGQVSAQLRLAEWYALPFRELEQRETGLALARQARTVAAAAESKAEAALCIGRLQDLLGRRDEALAWLSEAVEGFQRLRIRRREGVARLLLASAHANLGRLDDAESLLVAALPLLRATGDAPGQVTALRNLAEIEAARGRPAWALERFADALPLVRRQTVRFLNEDDIESSIAVPFFSAQLEEVAQLDQVEQFRERVADTSGGADHGAMPDELVRYLAGETVRAGSSANGERPLWADALARFIARLDDLGESYAPERRFADALVALTLDRPATVDAGERYGDLVDQIRARIEQRRVSAAPLFSDDLTRFYAHNTAAARLGTPEERRDWARRLRRDRRLATELGDRHEAQLLAALHAVLDDRPIALRGDNPYRGHLESVHDRLRRYQRPADALLAEGTVAVRTVMPANRDAWLEYLAAVRRDALIHGEAEAQAFVEALAALVAGTPAALPADNPHARLVDTVADAIAHCTPLEVSIPPAQLEFWRAGTVAALTSAPKSVDAFSGELAAAGKNAQGLGRYDEPQLYAALIRLLGGEPPRLPPGNRYEGLLQDVIDAAHRAPRAAHRDATLPKSQVTELVGIVSAALTGSPEMAAAARDFMARFEARCQRRGREWKQERAFAGALLALLDGRRPNLRACRSYADAVEDVIRAIEEFGVIRARGGNLAPDELARLLRETERAIRVPREIVEEQLNSPDGLMAAFKDSRMSDAVGEQVRWQETLAELRADFARRGPGWRHEVMLVESLLTALDSGEPRLPPESPYAGALDEMLEAAGHWSGLPRQDTGVKALALDKEAHREYFAGMLTGKTQFRRDLDALLALTVGALTVQRDSFERVSETLGRVRGDLERYAGSAFGAPDELAMVGALEALLRGATPALPADSPYRAHLEATLRSVELFSGPPAPGRLSADQIAHLCIMTPGVLSIGPEHLDSFRDEVEAGRDAFARMGPDGDDARALLEAVLIVLDGRPADLPLENPYRPFLELAQMQLRARR